MLEEKEDGSAAVEIRKKEGYTLTIDPQTRQKLE